MSDSYSSLGESLGKLVSRQHYALDPVIYIVNLTAPSELLLYCIYYHSEVIFNNIGLHRVAVNRRLFDDGHISDTAHSHIEGPRYRCCREGKHINALEKLLEALLLGNSEALLLIYYDKA